MDAQRFDAFARALGTVGSRRRLFRVTLGALAAGPPALLSRSRVGAVKWLPSLTNCGGVEVDLNTDRNNCGACGNVCPPFNRCVGGECGLVLIVCASPLSPCGDECVNLQTDAHNCGSCSHECASGGCRDGECYVLCKSGYTQCGEDCVNLNTDRHNCGACGNDCGGSICEDGECVTPSICTPPLVYCAGNCVDFQTNSAHCGECGNACPDGWGCCDGECVDLSSTFEHCGACGNLCGAYEGSACCGGVCVNLFADPFNCGDCGVVCPGGAICVRDPGGLGAICVCPDDLTDCGDYCADLLTDPYNCGACWNQCPPGQGCAGGVCSAEEPVIEPTATATAEPTATSEATARVDAWKLWTGKAKLRGAHLLQRRVDPDRDDPALGAGPVGPVYARADFDRLASLGANVVEIVHTVPTTQNPPYKSYTKLRDNLDRLVDRAARAGLFVVIGFRNGPGRPERALDQSVVCQAGGCLAAGTSSDATLWDDERAQEAWATAWEATAKRFRSHPAVVGYDLLVAPDAPTLSAWEDLAGRLTDAVRETDPDTPILVGLPPDPADLLDWRPGEDARTVYRTDLFPPDRYLLQLADATEPLTYPGAFDPGLDGVSGRFDRTWLEMRLLSLEAFGRRHDVPVALGAYGVGRWQPGAADFLSDALDETEGAGLSHSLWLWYPEDWAEADAFDVERGADPEERHTVPNDLLDAVRATWRQNTDFPEES